MKKMVHDKRRLVMGEDSKDFMRFVLQFVKVNKTAPTFEEVAKGTGLSRVRLRNIRKRLAERDIMEYGISSKIYFKPKKRFVEAIILTGFKYD